MRLLAEQLQLQLCHLQLRMPMQLLRLLAQPLLPLLPQPLLPLRRWQKGCREHKGHCAVCNELR